MLNSEERKIAISALKIGKVDITKRMVRNV